ncbi:MAG: YggS family pyridoxal phosphate-dependent enzyme [Lachnospiraceae bacterium]|nr:YggS family pyridoxal phosphate-dependent enzyme [Lachnospiraceae bacterium]
MSDIAQNIKHVREQIKKANKDTRLIAVSKTKPVEMLQEAYDAGMRDFGENKVQEILDKYDKLPSDIRWHMIGHLQTNKVKYIADKVYMIHSVDSVKLATEISRRAIQAGRVIPVLIEINIGNEDSKFGIKPDELEDLLRQIADLEGIKISGLMCVAPYTEYAEENRVYFKQMKQLSVDIMQKNIDNVFMNVLSMGMSGDYEVASSEGATYVRVGTGIFGERDYNI